MLALPLLLLTTTLCCPARAQGQISVEYVPPRNAAHTALYETLKSRRALEKLQEMFSPFRLPAKIMLSTLPCDGQSNAWYFQRVVGVCYEYLEAIQDKIADLDARSVSR